MKGPKSRDSFPGPAALQHDRQVFQNLENLQEETMGVSVRKKGSHYFIFIRHNGDRAAKQYESQDEAEAVAVAVRNKIALGEFDIAALKAARTAKEEESSIPTLKEYFEKSFTPEYLAGGVRKSTQAAYAGAFDRYILPELGDKLLNAITRAHVKSFVGSL